MAGYNVTKMPNGRYRIMNSERVQYDGVIKDGYFICETNGKKARLLGTLKHEFKRSFFRNGRGEDYVFKEKDSDGILYEVLNAIDENVTPTEHDYILLANWE